MKNQSKLKLRSSIGRMLAVYLPISVCSKKEAAVSDQSNNRATFSRLRAQIPNGYIEVGVYRSNTFVANGDVITRII
jgi:hypothetical protein